VSDGINEVHVRGNAGRDAELRYMTSGVAQASFSVAVSRWLRDQDDRSRGREVTDWINVVAWGDLAENASGAVLKGESVEVWGRLSTRSWENDKGERQYRTEVVASRVVAAGTEVQTGRGAAAVRAQRRTATPSDAGDGVAMYETATGRPVRAGGEVDPDDLPFE